MGNNNCKRMDNLTHSPLLCFDNKICGENITISTDRRVAIRTRSYCKGICYSNRPLNIGENVCIKIIQTSTHWSGGLRLGFTIINPYHKYSKNLEKINKQESINLPKCAISRMGCWINSLPLDYMKIGNLISFKLNNQGDVVYSVNGSYKGVIISNLPVKEGLKYWAIFDIYGSFSLLNNDFSLQNNNQLSNTKHPTSSNLTKYNTQSDTNFGLPSDDLNTNDIFENKHLKSLFLAIPSSISRYYKCNQDSRDPNKFNVLAFHNHPFAKGKNIQVHPILKPRHSSSTLKNRRISDMKSNSNLVDDLTVRPVLATRLPGEFCNAYAFTERPIELNEKVIVKILITDQTYIGSLAFGLTSCNPMKLTSSDLLPDEANFLVDRPEYWVVVKDIIATPPKKFHLNVGDEIATYINNLGQVIIERNGIPIGPTLYVDVTQSLWAFWDVYGSVEKIQLLGSYFITLNLEQLHVQNRLESSHQAQTPFSTIDSNNNSIEPNYFLIHNDFGSLVENRCDNSTNSANNGGATDTRVQDGGSLSSSLIPQDIYELSPRTCSNIKNSSSRNDHANFQESSAFATIADNNNNNNQSVISSIPATNDNNDLNNNSIQTRKPLNADRFDQYYDCIDNNDQNTSQAGANHCPKGKLESDSLSQILNGQHECVVCYETNIDCFLYPCGHACMCYPCAIQTWKMMESKTSFSMSQSTSQSPTLTTSLLNRLSTQQRSRLPSIGLCPICRKDIKDVVKFFLP